MVSRIQNRNTGYSENLFSHNTRVENNTLNSIDGATALKLDENYRVEEKKNQQLNNIENELISHSLGTSNEINPASNNIPEGVSIESASYIENNNLEENESLVDKVEESEDEHAPILFSENQSYQSDDGSEFNEQENKETEQLFDQDINEEEDFEIPAFLRKQKF